MDTVSTWHCWCNNYNCLKNLCNDCIFVCENCSAGFCGIHIRECLNCERDFCKDCMWYESYCCHDCKKDYKLKEENESDEDKSGEDEKS